MIDGKAIVRKTVLSHFRKRSQRYDQSSRWVVDPALFAKILRLASLKGDETVLDIATGTGLVAEQFKGKVRKLIGLDVSTDMSRQAARHLDRLILAPVESIPLPDASIDLCVCRQGLQFVDLPQAAREIARVLRPGGKAVLCHLAAYGPEDEKDAFNIQALRNPARVNFFKPGDLESVFEAAGFRCRETTRYFSYESVDRWIGHGANSAEQRLRIKEAYRRANPDFKRLHEIREANGDIIDKMLFLLIVAEKCG